MLHVSSESAGEKVSSDVRAFFRRRTMLELLWWAVAPFMFFGLLYLLYVLIYGA